MRASCESRPARLSFAGLAVVLSLLVSGGARADDPASQSDALRARNTSLAAKSHQVLLRLYSLQTRLAQSQRRVDALKDESTRLEREEESARLQLAVARDNVASAHSQLGQRLRHNSMGLSHLSQTHHISGPDVASRLRRNFEIVVLITRIRAGAPQI